MLRARLSPLTLNFSASHFFSSSALLLISALVTPTAPQPLSPPAQQSRTGSQPITTCHTGSIGLEGSGGAECPGKEGMGLRDQGATAMSDQRVGSLRVAVVGAGAAGLAAAKELRAQGLKVDVFEQNDDIGGVWKYSQTTEHDLLGTLSSSAPQPLSPSASHTTSAPQPLSSSTSRVHSSLYASLRTNLPREVMSFRSFPFGPEYTDGGQRFPHHTAVQKYLLAFTEHFDLRTLVRFNHRVLSLKPRTEPEGQMRAGWILTHCRSEGAECSEKETEEFDFVVVCNGHYSEPLVPKIPGAENFKGHLSHSHNYREPSRFKDEIVLVLGAAASGEDISREISTVASKVYVSARWPPEIGNPSAPGYGPRGNIYRRHTLHYLGPNSAHFIDGSSIEKIDSIIFCTGYHYKFPFLDGVPVIKAVDNFVYPLYKQIFCATHPSIAFIGLPSKIIPFPQFELQAKYIAKAWAGSVELPSIDSMSAEVEREVKEKHDMGIPQKYFHVLGGDQFEYNDELARICGVERLPEWRKLMYIDCHRNKGRYPDSYRDAKLPEIDDYPGA